MSEIPEDVKQQHILCVIFSLLFISTSNIK